MHNITYIDGIDVSATLISRITDKILPEIREWQNGYLKACMPLDSLPPSIFRSERTEWSNNTSVYGLSGFDVK